MIRSALAAESLDPRCLEIELTEGAVMTNPEESAAILQELSAMGVLVSVDDFGRTDTPWRPPTPRIPST